jgi:hypothetical protein
MRRRRRRIQASEGCLSELESTGTSPKEIRGKGRGGEVEERGVINEESAALLAFFVSSADHLLLEEEVPGKLDRLNW